MNFSPIVRCNTASIYGVSEVFIPPTPLLFLSFIHIKRIKASKHVIEPFTISSHRRVIPSEKVKKLS